MLNGIFIFLIVVSILLAFVILYFVPGQTGTRFAWEIRPLETPKWPLIQCHRRHTPPGPAAPAPDVYASAKDKREAGHR